MPIRFGDLLENGIGRNMRNDFNSSNNNVANDNVAKACFLF